MLKSPVFHQSTTVNRSPDLAVREIRTTEELESIRPLWNALLMKSAAPVLYLTYDWLSTWWQCFQTPRKKLSVLAVFENDELVGIAPFVRTRAYWLGIPYVKMEFISMMRYALSPTNISGTLDFIIRADKHQEVIPAVMEFLLKKAWPWNYIRMHPLPSGSPSQKPLENAAGKIGFRFWKRPVFVNSIIRLNRPWTEYTAEVGRKFRKNIQGHEKRLQNNGVLRYSELNAIEQLENGFNSILSIERRSWKWNKGIHIDAPVYRHFYRQLVEVAGKNGWLKLGIMSLDGKNIAYDLSLEFNRSIEGLKTSYDEKYAHYSPGNVLIYHQLESVFQKGYTKKNLLWGDLNVKTKWTSTVEPHDEILIYRNDLFSNVLYFINHRLFLYRLTRFLFNQTQMLYWKLGS